MSPKREREKKSREEMKVPRRFRGKPPELKIEFPLNTKDLTPYIRTLNPVYENPEQQIKYTEK